MCFVIGKRNKIRRAKRNICCWKIGNYFKSSFRSSIRNHSYFKNSWTPLLFLRIVKERDYAIGGMCGLSNVINVGYHSYSNREVAISLCPKTKHVVKFIIPKGSKYYYNRYFHEFVSNQIIWKD